MPSKKQYNLVQNDEYDTRIPLHNEEAFHRGIVFHAKFIGSMEVPRPTSRVEIVAAMRRVRYEFKSKGIKKKKVSLEVSVNGLRVTLRKKKKKQQWIEENKSFQINYPIYRIFYVSHDSHDLKIFSYIARDGSSNSFKCSVFKSNKKSQAMKIVRTVGQAFEVCHKLSLNAENRDQQVDNERSIKERSEEHLRSEDYEDEMINNPSSITPTRSPTPDIHKDISLLGDEEYVPQDPSLPIGTCVSRMQDFSAPLVKHAPSEITQTECVDVTLLSGNELMSLKHEIQLLRERLNQQNQQTRAAVAHARLLQDQLAAESSARIEAQARTHQLLVQNKELLEHISALVNHLKEQERALEAHDTSTSSQGANITINSAIPQVSINSDISNLGQQSYRTSGQNSPWDMESSTFTCTSTPELYSLATARDTTHTSADFIQFQTQLIERLHDLSPYSIQRSCTTPSSYTIQSPNFFSSSNNKILSPSSPIGLSLQIGQSDNFSSSPVMPHKMPIYTTSVENPSNPLSELQTLIKPLPCFESGNIERQRSSLCIPGISTKDKETHSHKKQKPNCLSQISITSDLAHNKRLGNSGRSALSMKLQDNHLANEDNAANTGDNVNAKNIFSMIFESTGAPPSRTTSTRLPPRTDLLNKTQFQNWTRHTTK